MNHLYKFKYYLSESEWLVPDDSFAVEDQTLKESIFTLGNGYLGSRGTYEENPQRSDQGTFFAGIYNKNGQKVAELLNAPNPFFLRLSVDNQFLEAFQTNVTGHHRTLDMNKGLLHRQTLFRTETGTVIDYQSLRFLSMADKHLGVMTVDVTSHDRDLLLTFDISIDLNVYNLSVTSQTKFFEVVREEHEGSLYFLTVRSLDGQHEISYGQRTTFSYKDENAELSSLKTTLKIERGKPLVLTKYLIFMTSNDIPDENERKLAIVKKLQTIARTDFHQVIEEHLDAWQERWQSQDIQLQGDPPLQHALRFNLYQLIIAAHPHAALNSVAAKLLTGEGYLGHIFWEAELLLLPAYLAAQPSIARDFLEYRFRRLAPALQIAESKNYRGALYPWESAGSGYEETPKWSVDLDGTMTPVYTAKYAFHVNLAIFYAINYYYLATADVEFMLSKGLAMMISLCRFWRSKIALDHNNNLYQVEHVMGPDEFHVDINNSYYINFLIAWSFKRLVELVTQFQTDYSVQTTQLLKNCHFYEKDQEKLLHISENIHLPTKKKLLIQFDQYLTLRPTEKIMLNAEGLPMIPSNILVADLGTTQYVKQPEVVLLFMLFPNLFSDKTKEENFEFYNSRTLHRSSWSPPVSSAVAAQLGQNEQAYHYLQLALFTDLKNIFANSQSGIHAPTVGGAWNAIIRGFAGLDITDQGLVLKPNLFSTWRALTFKIFYRDFYVNFTLEQDKVAVFLEEAAYPFLTRQSNRPSFNSVRVQVGSKFRTVRLGKVYYF